MQMSLPRGKMNAFMYGACWCLGCCDSKIRKESRYRTRNPNHKSKKTLRDYR